MINQFREEYSFLSNFAAVNIVYGDITFPSVENYYVAMKTKDNQERLKISKMKPGEAKKYGRTLKIREDWDDIKLEVMMWGVSKKFLQEPYKSKLLATGMENIVEGNYWGDSFWGIDLKQDPNIGENNLGRILMIIRRFLKDEK